MPTRMDDVDALARISGGSGAEIVARMYQNYTRGTQQLDRASIQYFYRRYGILKKLVNVPANQMTYRWGYLQLGGKRGDAKIRDAFEAFTDQLPVETLYNHRLGLRTAFGLAQKAANKMGNGAILMDLDDGEDLDRPINFNKLKGIRRLYVLDRWSLKPLIIGSTRDHDFYQLGGVAFSRFLTDVRRGAAVQAVHKSRVLWFRGEELDDNELMRTGGCDDSVFESTISSFLDYRASICGAKQMIQDFDIFVHELEGLLTELETDGNQEYETLIRERIEINDRMRRLHRTMLVDKDKERIGHSSRQVSGYSDLMDRVLNDFLANVELTPAELLGKYPEGMADTGKTEQQNANDRTSRYQEEKFRSNIVAFCKVLFRCKEFVTQGKLPDTWKFVFELLYPVTPPEQAELQLNYAQIDDINIRNGVYSGDDVARSRYGSADFQPNIIIDFKKREAAQKAAQEGEAPPEGEGAPEDDIEALLANYQTDSADPVRLLPPPEVRQAVQQALKFAREKGIKIPATLQTLTLNLSMGVPLREEEVRSMNLFFMQPKNRKVAKQPPEEGYGAILWLAMGGDIGERWSGAIEREFLRRRDGVRADVVTVSARTDDDTPIKRAIHWKEYQIGLQYEALDERHGRILPLAYGEFLGLRSEHDGMNADVYVGSELGSDRVFAVTQLDYDTGEFDEVKFIIGVHKPIDEVAKLYQAIMTPQHFGGIVEITKEEIPTYKPQTYLSRKGDAAKPEHIAMGVGAAAAIGAGAFLLNKMVEHRQREGQKCGESYISANYQCRIGEQGGQVSPQAEKVIALVSAQNREIIEFATNPKMVPLLEEEVDFAKEILAFAKKANDSVSPGSFDAKVLKIQKLTGATEVEAAALAGYLGPIYKQMNKYFHSRVSTGDEASRKLERKIAAPNDDMITVNKAAINALKKIESVTESRIQKEIRTTFKGKSVGWNDLGNEFYHHARIESPEIFSQIDQGYKALKKENKTFPLEKFLSTTMHQAGLIGFKEKSNLEIKIKPRLDGKGGGKLVDRFKNSLIEYEILYVPGTQFKVKEVRNQLIRTVKKKNGSKDEIRYLTIELEEV